MTTAEPFSHCHFCGSRYTQPSGWPRPCQNCGNVTYRNPEPVAVLIVPVEQDGVLLVRRAIAPVGLALVGGFIDHGGESWQQAAAREAAEETGLQLDPAAIEHVRTVSAPDGRPLIFGRCDQVSREEIRVAFTPTEEVSELVICTEMPAGVVFGLHAEVLRGEFMRLRALKLARR